MTDCITTMVYCESYIPISYTCFVATTNKFYIPRTGMYICIFCLTYSIKSIEKMKKNMKFQCLFDGV
jgi:hypothetical protein